ncbi:HVA22-like protein f [Cucumis melo var. makuwa]|uniref:HVA22-like protein n=1 Tax=Cucumis melo var. makuwa TaxID=1194695 RepID=A0A5A7V335_CUCMM|nr:HVA22-like protein f [Cucumis melo var. makuwa]TYK21150.1 HVA22-like protein f [Cucumis melo var. makuwa]
MGIRNRYESKLAMEKPSSREHQQWLTYWVLLSLLTLFELYLSTIISWIPLWPYIKLVFCLWLALPSFKGAAYVFENIAMKYIKVEDIEENPERDLEEEKKEKEDMKKKAKEDMKKKDDEDEAVDEDEDDEEDEDEDEAVSTRDEKKVFRAWKLVDDYIEKNGADSLEKIVKAGLQGN